MAREETSQREYCPLWKCGPCKESIERKIYCRQTGNEPKGYLLCGICQDQKNREDTKQLKTRQLETVLIA